MSTAPLALEGVTVDYGAKRALESVSLRLAAVVSVVVLGVLVPTFLACGVYAVCFLA